LVIEVAVDANTALDSEALTDSAQFLNISASGVSTSFSLVSRLAHSAAWREFVHQKALRRKA
jgi:hypothetical protein